MPARGFYLPNEEFITFPVERIIDNSVTDFDLFLNIADHMILYGNLGYRWERDELEGLLKHGHTHFLTRKKDASKVKMYEEVSKIPVVNEKLNPRQRIAAIEKIGATFIQCLFEGEVTKACVEKASQIADSITACVLEDPGCVQALSHLIDHDQYVFYHSIRVSSYATAIAVAMGLTDPIKLREIALGGIFHDLGKKDVGLHIINKRGPLTNSEWKIMRAHPVFGHQTIQKSILSHIPQEIILHHHEKPDGSGYPHGLDRNSILTEVEIASMADIYDAITSSRAYQQKRNTYEALDFVKHQLVNKKLMATDVYMALVRCLAK